MKTVRELLEEYAANIEANLPRPSVAWFKLQLESSNAEASTAEIAVPSWWERLLKLLPAGADEPAAGALLAFGSARGKEFVARRNLLGVVPAAISREHGISDEVEIAGVAVLQRPMVSEDGRLVLGIQVPKQSFVPRESLDLLVLSIPDSKPVGPSVCVSAGADCVLSIALPPELQVAWRGLERWEWAKLPFRLQLIRHARNPGEAAKPRFWPRLNKARDTIGSSLLWFVEGSKVAVGGILRSCQKRFLTHV